MCNVCGVHRSLFNLSLVIRDRRFSLETLFMRCQNLFSEENKIHISKCRLLKLLPIMLCDKWASARQKQRNGMCAQRRQISLGAFAQSDQSSLCAHWVAKDPSFLHADSKDPDQTGRLICLRWVHMVLSCAGSMYLLLHEIIACGYLL